MDGNGLNLENPITDAVSRIRFAPQSNNLLISSWDSVSFFLSSRVVLKKKKKLLSLLSNCFFFLVICRCLDYMMQAVLSFDWKLHRKRRFSTAASRKRLLHLVLEPIAALEGADHSFIPIETLITVCVICVCVMWFCFEC